MIMITQKFLHICGIFENQTYSLIELRGSELNEPLVTLSIYNVVRLPYSSWGSPPGTWAPPFSRGRRSRSPLSSGRRVEVGLNILSFEYETISDGDCSTEFITVRSYARTVRSGPMPVLFGPVLCPYCIFDFAPWYHDFINSNVNLKSDFHCLSSYSVLGQVHKWRKLFRGVNRGPSC